MMLRKVGGTSCGKVFLFWIVAGFIGYLLELVFGIAIRALVDPDQFFNLLLRAVTNLYSLC